MTADLDTATDTPRPTLRHLSIPGCTTETWVVTSVYHNTTEVIAVAPATGDADPGWEVTWRIDRHAATCYDWAESRTEMVAAARELAEGRLAEMVTEWDEWAAMDDNDAAA